MDIILSQTECRILGSLVEKELTTPDYYPLSLNSLLNACNQKSNRQPVLTLAEEDVITALDRLRHLGLAMQSREGGRVAKFCHTLREKLHLDEEELAVLAELLLRGAQTPGEIRARADRMTELETLEITEEILYELINRDVPLITKLPRQAGRKENRYTHLLCEAQELESERNNTGGQNEQSVTTIQKLEEEIETLRLELDELRQELNDFKKEFS